MKGRALLIILSVFLLFLCLAPAMAGDETVSPAQRAVGATDDERFIREAFDLAISSGKNGDHTFGALLVYRGKIILTSGNTVNTDNNSTHHAETNLMAKARRELSPQVIRESTLYAGAEPCTFCCAVMYYTGVTKVVYGVSSEALQNLTGWHDEGLACDELYRLKGKRLIVIGPILEKEGLEVFRYMPKKK